MTILVETTVSQDGTLPVVPAHLRATFVKANQNERASMFNQSFNDWLRPENFVEVSKAKYRGEIYDLYGVISVSINGACVLPKNSLYDVFPVWQGIVEVLRFSDSLERIVLGPDRVITFRKKGVVSIAHESNNVYTGKISRELIENLANAGKSFFESCLTFDPERNFSSEISILTAAAIRH